MSKSAEEIAFEAAMKEYPDPMAMPCFVVGQTESERKRIAYRKGFAAGRASLDEELQFWKQGDFVEVEAENKRLREFAELYLEHEMCHETSCPVPMRAMCSNPMHKMARQALKGDT